MNKIVLLVVVLVGAVLAYNYATTGKLSLLPQGPLSGEEQELQRLEQDFETAARDFNQALRSAGLAGLDTTGDADAAMQEVLRIERKLDGLKRRLVANDERIKAERLKQRLEEFKRKVGA
jgi:hypothetical protein